MGENVLSKEFQQYCEKVCAEHQIPGFAMGLMKDGAFAAEKYVGERDKEEQLVPTRETVFGIGSVTKSFTCMAIMQLQEAGKLTVHDSVIDYLPSFQTPSDEATKKITIHHLMTHTAGIPPLSTLFAAMKRSMENDPKVDSEEETATPEEVEAIDTYDELLHYMAEEEYALFGAPGEVFSYSNDSYALLGAIIEQVSKQSYETYVKSHILKPIGMTNTVFHLEELASEDDVAVLYDAKMEEDVKIVYPSNNQWDAPAMRSAGFLKSTITDMLKYADMFLQEGKSGSTQILTKESIAQMIAPHTTCGPGIYYGYGLMIRPDYYGYKLIEHGGSLKGVAAQLNMMPELGLTGIAFANLAGVPTSKLLHSAFADWMGKSVDVPTFDRDAVATTPEQLDMYTGVFKSGEGADLTFSMEDGKLMVTTPDITGKAAKCIGKDLFLLNHQEDNIAIRFVRNEANEVVRVAFGFRQIPKA